MIRKEKQENRRIVLEIISTNLSNRVTKKQIKSKLEKVKEIKQEFPNIDIKVGSFKEGNKCKVLKNIYAISVIQKINDIAKKYE